VRATLWPARPPQTDFRKAQSAPFVPGCSAGARFCVRRRRVRENRLFFFTKRVVAPSNRAFPSEKKRHLFFDENTVGAD
jgi:hypothetical protein